MFNMNRNARQIVLLFLVCAAVYTLNLRVVGAGDCWGPRYLPVSLLKEGNLDLNEFRGIKFGIIKATRGEHTYRLFKSPILSGILATPFYALAWLLGIPITGISIAYLGKVAATVYSSLSVVFIFLILKRLLPSPAAVFISLVYAFATCTWSISSQSLWQHGLGQCFLAGGLYCLFTAVDKPAFAGAAGVFFSLATLARYMNGVVALVMFIYVIHRYRSQVIKFVIFSLPAITFFLVYNWFYFHHPLHFATSWAFGRFVSSFREGFSGLLFSPNRGLFVFSPVFLFSIAGAIRAWKDRSAHRVLYRYIIISAVLFILIISKWLTWWGGHCYGYRMLVDITPLLIILIAPVYEVIKEKKIFRALFMISVAISFLIQLLGALYYDTTWNWKVARSPQSVWWVKDGQIPYLIKKAARDGWKVRKTLILPPGDRRKARRYL